MAKLMFHLVSPASEFFSGEVDQVNIPGADGDFGVLANHTPLMTSVDSGVLVVINGGDEQRIYVSGGFAEITADGLTVLAEFALPEAELKGEALAHAKERAETSLKLADTPAAIIAAQRAVDALAAY